MKFPLYDAENQITDEWCEKLNEMANHIDILIVDLEEKGFSAKEIHSMLHTATTKSLVNHSFNNANK